MSITFRLTDGLDPEERLEEACLWKAMYDASGRTAVAVTGETPATFGRSLSSEKEQVLNYWRDPAFLKETCRKFSVHDLHHASLEVARLHRSGYDAFVKSTRSKHAIFHCSIGTSFYEAVGDMAYSFIDGGPGLMVQQHVKMEYEWRFFCVNRKIVTDSSNHPHLTPFDYPLERAYISPASPLLGDRVEEVRPELLAVAKRIAKSMQEPTAVIDCAYINELPGCVELNSFRPGDVGLFACDVRRLAAAFIPYRHQERIEAWMKETA